MAINLLEVSKGKFVVIPAICSAKLVPSELEDYPEVLVLTTSDGSEHPVSSDFFQCVYEALFVVAQ